MLDGSLHDPSQFDNSQINLSPNFEAMKNNKIKIDDEEKGINNSVQIEQAKM